MAAERIAEFQHFFIDARFLKTNLHYFHCAGYAVNKFDSVEETIDRWVKVKKEIQPDMEKYKEYEDKYHQFLDVYNSLQEYKIRC